MDYAVSRGGLLVHARQDWPCALCRPQGSSEAQGFWLCARCAHGMIIAAEAGVEAARALLDDVTEALVRLEGQSHDCRLPTN
jgi:ribosomal protein L37AE/L43A